MGHVEPTLPSSTRDATVVNAALSNIGVGAGAIERENYAERAFGPEVLEGSCMEELVAVVNGPGTTSTVTPLTNNTYATPTIGVTLMDTQATAGTITIEADEVLIIEASVELRTMENANEPGVQSGSYVEAVIAGQENGSAAAVFTGTKRSKGGKAVAVSGGPKAGIHGDCTLQYRFDPGGVQKVYDWFALQLRILGGGSYIAADAVLTVERVKRASIP